ncbi:hypothetical protein CN689_00400 [Peribacillus butanolivorans]|uniref:Uncharacterized protein n=1 Tax=Peribacillus butanolivorans TaxID=421767 RepID=A0AAX0S7J9_9BACI|nr:hypothetical protein CN689_00400 [Peribacillus butanolivorans]
MHIAASKGPAFKAGKE